MALITKPAKIIEHIINAEAGASVEVPTYNDDNIDLAFTVHDKQINSKKLIEGVASNSRIIPYFKDNELRIQNIHSYVSPELEDDNGDVKLYIEQSDIISYDNKRTSPEKVYTKVVVNYNYNYALKEFSKNTKDNSQPDTAYEHFQIEDNWHGNTEDGNQYYSNTYYGISPVANPEDNQYKDQDYTFDAHYIRSDSSAENLQQFLLLWHCNQHNILKLKLPLKYIQLSIGDYVGFDKLINGVKLFGEDYSISGWKDPLIGAIIRNGQQILPVWMVTATNKTLTHIDIELIQMHNCTGTFVDVANYPPEMSNLQMELTHPIPELQADYVMSTNIAIIDDTQEDLDEYFTLNLSATVNDINEDSSTVTFYCSLDELLIAFDGDDAKVQSFVEDLKYDNDWTWYTGDDFVTKTFSGVSSGQNVETEIVIGWKADNESEESEGYWLSDWLEVVEVGDYIEFRSGLFSVMATDSSGASNENATLFPYLRVFKNELHGMRRVNYSAGWNLVSLPLDVEDATYTTLFPESVVGTLYGYDGVYSQLTDMIPGKGYWLNFLTAGSTIIFGEEIPEVSISLNQGWNLIGGINSQIDTSLITDPEGIIVPGTVFGFDGVYSNSDVLMPGEGYWINANSPGEISISV